MCPGAAPRGIKLKEKLCPFCKIDSFFYSVRKSVEYVVWKYCGKTKPFK